MKVVFATGIFPPDIGGPATSVSTLAQAWSDAGHRIAVVTYADPGAAPVPTAYETVRVSRALPAWRRYWAFLRALWRASDVPGPIFAQDGVASGLPALVVSALKRRRLIVRVAGDYAWERAQVRHGYADALETFQKDLAVPPSIHLLRALQRFVYRRADDVIVPSRYLAEVARGWGVRASRLRVIYNGVHLPEKADGVAKKPLRVMAAGRLVPWKNFDVLIKAMPKVLERFPDATLSIAGDGPESERLRALATSPMLRGKVTFVGRLKKDELCRAIAESAVFVLPSSYEGFSHQLVEAFACGAAVVASRAGGNPELMEDGKNGLLVAPGDALGLAHAINAFLEDPIFAEVCAKEAGKDLSRFSIETQIRETSEVVLGDASGPRVVIVSRDALVVQPDSDSARRMASYKEKVGALRIVVFARASANPMRIIRLCLEVLDEARGLKANLIVAQEPFETGLAALFVSRWLGIPFIVEDHGSFFDGDVWLNERWYNRLRWHVGRFVAARATGIRPVSERGASAYKAFGIKAPVRVIPVAMRLAEKVVEPHRGPFTVLYAGRYSAEKNLPLLLNAFVTLKREVPDARLLLVGQGPEERMIREFIERHGLASSVEFRPWVHDVGPVFADADVAALPSNREGYSRFPLEAMSYGLPVVITAVGSAGSIVRDGVEGFVVPIGDQQAFAAALIRLAKDPMLRAMLRAAGMQRARSIPSPQETAKLVTDFWKSIAGV